MKLEDCKINTRVQTIDSPDAGRVVARNNKDGFVYVAFRKPNGEDDVMEFDPADLEPATEEKI
jgi:hypothetical protein